MKGTLTNKTNKQKSKHFTSFLNRKFRQWWGERGCYFSKTLSGVVIKGYMLL